MFAVEMCYKAGARREGASPRGYCGGRKPSEASGFLDFLGDFVDEFFQLLFLGAVAAAVFLEECLDLASEVLSLFGGEKDSGSGAYDGASQEGVKDS